MSDDTSGNRPHAAPEFAAEPANFMPGKRAVEDAETVVSERAEKTERLRTARLARELAQKPPPKA